MIASFEDHLLTALRAFNHLLHAFLALALVMASLMVLWEFSVAVVHSVEMNNLAHGFLQSLGTLFIVWTLSSLISAEINYVQTGVFHVVVFIEVAMITLLRQLLNRSRLPLQARMLSSFLIHGTMLFCSPPCL